MNTVIHDYNIPKDTNSKTKPGDLIETAFNYSRMRNIDPTLRSVATATSFVLDLLLMYVVRLDDTKSNMLSYQNVDFFYDILIQCVYEYFLANQPRVHLSIYSLKIVLNSFVCVGEYNRFVNIVLERYAQIDPKPYPFLRLPHTHSQWWKNAMHDKTKDTDALKMRSFYPRSNFMFCRTHVNYYCEWCHTTYQTYARFHRHISIVHFISPIQATERIEYSTSTKVVIDEDVYDANDDRDPAQNPFDGKESLSQFNMVFGFRSTNTFGRSNRNRFSPEELDLLCKNFTKSLDEIKGMMDYTEKKCLALLSEVGRIKRPTTELRKTYDELKFHFDLTKDNTGVQNVKILEQYLKDRIAQPQTRWLIKRKYQEDKKNTDCDKYKNAGVEQRKRPSVYTVPAVKKPRKIEDEESEESSSLDEEEKEEEEEYEETHSQTEVSSPSEDMCFPKLSLSVSPPSPPRTPVSVLTNSSQFEFTQITSPFSSQDSKNYLSPRWIASPKKSRAQDIPSEKDISYYAACNQYGYSEPQELEFEPPLPFMTEEEKRTLSQLQQEEYEMKQHQIHEEMVSEFDRCCDEEVENIFCSEEF